tara:strand:+ start:688 stop:3042 length:2355 start_codon:yes stop_codon:yes gene_type:complete
MAKKKLDQLKFIFKQKKYKEAKELSINLINLDNNNIQALKILRDCEIKLGEDPEKIFLKIINYYTKSLNFKKALNEFEDFIEIKPNFRKKFLHLGELNLKLGNTELARKNFNDGIKENFAPSYCLYGLGLIEKKDNNNKLALKFFEKSINLEEFPDNLNEAGLIYSTSAELLNEKKAEIFFNKAMQKNHRHIPSCINNGFLMQRQFRYVDSLKSFLLPFYKNNKYELDISDEFFNTMTPFIMLALNSLANSNIEFTEIHENIFKYVLENGNFSPTNAKNCVYKIFTKENNKLIAKGVVNNFVIENQNIENFKYNLDELLLEELINDKIFNDYLNSSIIKKQLESLIVYNITAEKILTSIRNLFLKEIVKNAKKFSTQDSLNSFLYSLCVQLFKNEYSWHETKRENEEIKKLNKIIDSKIKLNKKIYDCEVQILGCYNSLGEYKFRNDLKNKNFNSKTKDIIKKQILDLDYEREISKKIKKVNNIEDPTSNRVLKQYEKNPYPRWDIEGELNESYNYINIIKNGIAPNRLPLKFLKKKNKIETLLIAGCGTGRHPINIALLDKNIKIDALDLSLPSLSYGKRKAEEMNIENITWLQGDILGFDIYKKKYDAIECCGVLHHMENPKKGFDILSNKLNPNGIIKIALYSKSFRKLLLPAKSFLNELNLGNNINDIRFARNLMSKNNNDSFSLIRRLPDFYTTSEFIDLLMHEQELDFTIEGLKDLYEEKFEFLGFVHGDRNVFQIQNFYKNKFPRDLYMNNINNWKKIEELDNTVFGGMYQFYLFKK